MIIGFCGKAGAGKSTAAAYLAERHGFVRVRFADPLKDMLRALGLNEREIEGDLKEMPCDLLKGTSPRRAMQTLGTEWGREIIHSDLWINAWMRRTAGTAKVIAEDLRFANEAAAIVLAGGKICRILRPNSENIAGDHASEKQGFPVDFDIVNAGSIDDLCKKLDGLINATEPPARKARLPFVATDGGYAQSG